MNGALLVITAVSVAVLPSPASSQSLSFAGLEGASAFRDIHFVAPRAAGEPFRRGGGRHFRHIHVGDGADAAPLAYGAGYLDPGDYDANRSFDPDRWNDWWHDRPDRAYPRWFWHNQNCDRMWWGGGAWRCGW